MQICSKLAVRNLTFLCLRKRFCSYFNDVNMYLILFVNLWLLQEESQVVMDESIGHGSNGEVNVF